VVSTARVSVLHVTLVSIYLPTVTSVSLVALELIAKLPALVLTEYAKMEIKTEAVMFVMKDFLVQIVELLPVKMVLLMKELTEMVSVPNVRQVTMGQTVNPSVAVLLHSVVMV
jgi:hypothetical protein